MRIAVADDEPILLAHLQKCLGDLLPNAQIEAFTQTGVLLENARTRGFDIAFLDIHMPGLTGLELAEELRKINSRMNLIFVTGYDGYQAHAMELFASGYIKKPVTKEKLLTQLDNLRYPVAEKRRVFMQTFGSFTVFIDGEPVSFSRSKSQMALAYLVHLHGGVVDKKDLSAVIFEDGTYDNNRMSYISKLCSDINLTLARYGIGDLFRISPAGLSVNTDAFDCDAYELLKEKPSPGIHFNGEYMTQYPFGEELIPLLQSLEENRRPKNGGGGGVNSANENTPKKRRPKQIT